MKNDKNDMFPQRHRGHRGPRGPRGEDFGPGFGPGFGPAFGPGFGPGPRGRGRRRGRKGGDVRAAALLILDEGPAHGYQLIQQIAERSEGAWTPSPGSIYPVLQQLEDEQLIEFERIDGRKTAQLTPEGEAYVEEHREELGTPWDDAQARGGFSDERRGFAKALRGTMGAVQQIMTSASDEQVAAATTVINDARKALYGILAQDDA